MKKGAIVKKKKKNDLRFAESQFNYAMGVSSQ